MWTGRSIEFSVQGRRILRGIDVAVKPGLVLAVLGANGAGKSTLFKVLTGESAPTGGEVALEQKPLPAWDARALALRRAAMAQHGDVPFPITVREVVLLGRSPHFGWKERPQDLAIAEDALREVDLAPFGSRLFPTLSGGEKQRVQLARALAQIESGEGEMQGRYLFMDEPVASLDLKHQHDVFLIARRLAARGAGVFVVLHDLNLALQYADEIMLLKEGEVVSSGAPGQALTREILEKTFEVAVTVERDDAGNPILIRHARR